MGELLRRYWQPVMPLRTSWDLPRKEKLLGEEIVVFRDKQGRVGALDPHCAHRGTSLEWGQIEERGIRCCYHGWLYDTQGQCIDMPCETAEFRQRMDVWQPAYPTHEYGGLVFAYMGPPGTEPLFRSTTSSIRIATTSIARHAPLGRIRRWHGQDWLAAALGEHRRSVASRDAAPE
jgi:phenylpropionate dioxygenase-like ring-hydroxylating dioxygenase large terminal subunit